ncbi:hypothetical protein [uncultured Thiodictyon sp.]|uniref:hypothetical protein n=1 Tax=uncultured Thiodictyon sp. TaxID=1846217 RepID=UPI0025F9739C|nr:hypothetical protein [uncultured Thiodictyon sp.]
MTRPASSSNRTVSLFPLLAQRYGQGEACASALLATTLLSFLTLNLGLWALGVGGTH